MASTYTVNTGIELIANGEQSGTWGDTTNTNLQIIDRLTNGVGAISLSGTTHTLTTTDGTLSDGQYAVLVFGGSPSGTNTVTISPNDAQHVYVVKNGSGQSVVLTQGSGGNVTIADGKSAIVYADGAGAGAAVVDVTNTFDFQPLTATLTAIGALTPTNSNIIVGDGSTWVAESGATARTSLGLAIGTDVLAYDSNLQGFVDAFTVPITDGTTGQVLSTNGSGTLSFIDVDGDISEVVAGDGLTGGGSSGSVTLTVGAGTGVTVSSTTVSIGQAVGTGNSPTFTGITITGVGNAENWVDDYDALSGVSPAPDADNAGAFSLTTSGNTTFTFGSVTSAKSYCFIIELTAGGTHTITWPASVEWGGGSAPDAPASGETDILVFWTRDGGTTWYGAQALDAAS